jgi:truncated hemoglobin YjbI
MWGMSNADANEEHFAEERKQLVRCICETVKSMRGPSLRKVDVITMIEQAAHHFEKETYDNDQC